MSAVGLMGELVTVEPRGVEDAYGDPAWGAGAQYKARVSGKREMRFSAQDRIMVPMQVVYLEPAAIATAPGDRLTLPDGDQREIRSVDLARRPNGSIEAVKVSL
ncbi:MAG: hypothetical protein RQ723_12035 [Desulfuromonadales bacterium]|nr:hypothetical protein [Desulfuromonadales bacterium]